MAMRSVFFEKLFFGDFRERGQEVVHLTEPEPLKSEIFENFLQLLHDEDAKAKGCYNFFYLFS